MGLKDVASEVCDDDYSRIGVGGSVIHVNIFITNRTGRDRAPSSGHGVDEKTAGERETERRRNWNEPTKEPTVTLPAVTLTHHHSRSQLCHASWVCAISDSLLWLQLRVRPDEDTKKYNRSSLSSCYTLPYPSLPCLNPRVRR